MKKEFLWKVHGAIEQRCRGRLQQLCRLLFSATGGSVRSTCPALGRPGLAASGPTSSLGFLSPFRLQWSLSQLQGSLPANDAARNFRFAQVTDSTNDAPISHGHRHWGSGPPQKEPATHPLLCGTAESRIRPSWCASRTRQLRRLRNTGSSRWSPGRSAGWPTGAEWAQPRNPIFKNPICIPVIRMLNFSVSRKTLIEYTQGFECTQYFIMSSWICRRAAGGEFEAPLGTPLCHLASIDSDRRGTKHELLSYNLVGMFS